MCARLEDTDEKRTRGNGFFFFPITNIKFGFPLSELEGVFLMAIKMGKRQKGKKA